MGGQQGQETVFSRIIRFAANRGGHIAVMGALSLPVMAGGVALATDGSHWLLEKTQLRFAIDAAAISAGQLYNRGIPEAQIDSAIRANLISAGYPAATLALNISYPDASTDLLTAQASYRAEKYFSQVIWDGIVNVTARTVVAVEGKQACVLALNETASGAVTMSGSGSATLTGCVVASNSNSDSSIYMGGSATLTTDCMVASGGINGESMVTTLCQKSKTYRRPTDDPYADLVQPDTPVSCTNPPNFKPGESNSLSPGCFRKDLDLKGTVTFAPGVYILDGADMVIGSGSVVSGTDVTFVLKNGASLKFNGGATIDLRAPDTGSTEPYPGILFWGANTNMTSHKINGDASSFMSGAIYLPDDAVELNGSSGFDTTCSRIVADTVTLIGNTEFSTNCTTQLGGYDVFTPDTVVIVD